MPAKRNTKTVLESKIESAIESAEESAIAEIESRESEVFTPENFAERTRLITLARIKARNGRSTDSPFGLTKDPSDNMVKRESVEKAFLRANLPSRYEAKFETWQALITVTVNGREYHGLVEYRQYSEDSTNKSWLGNLTVFTHSEKVHTDRTNAWESKRLRASETKRASMPEKNPTLRTINGQRFVQCDQCSAPLTFDGLAFNADSLEFSESKWSLYVNAIKASQPFVFSPETIG